MKTYVVVDTRYNGLDDVSVELDKRHFSYTASNEGTRDICFCEEIY